MFPCLLPIACRLQPSPHTPRPWPWLEICSYRMKNEWLNATNMTCLSSKSTGIPHDNLALQCWDLTRGSTWVLRLLCGTLHFLLWCAARLPLAASQYRCRLCQLSWLCQHSWSEATFVARQLSILVAPTTACNRNSLPPSPACHPSSAHRSPSSQSTPGR